MVVKAAIFDFDGVNRKILPIGWKLYLRGIWRLGFWRTLEIMEFVCYLALQELIAYFGIAMRFKPPKNHRFFCQDVIPGSIEMINVLKEKGFLLGIVTNRSRSMLDWHASRVGLDLKLFYPIVCRDGPLKKPNPAVFKTFQERWQIELSDIAYIGDRYEMDYLAAEHAGIGHIFMVCSGYTNHADFRRLGVLEEEIIDSIVDLPLHLWR